jgi:Calx-beta domain
VAGPLSFSAGQTSKNIVLAVVDDALDENDETGVLTQGTPTNGTLGTTTQQTVTITGDDPTPTVAFTGSSSTGAEDTETLNLAVSLSAVSRRTVTVPYSVTVGKAPGSEADSTIAGEPLSFSAGRRSKNIVLAVVDDALDEDDKTGVVTQGTPTNATLDTPAATMSVGSVRSGRWVASMAVPGDPDERAGPASLTSPSAVPRPGVDGAPGFRELDRRDGGRGTGFVENSFHRAAD